MTIRNRIRAALAAAALVWALPLCAFADEAPDYTTLQLIPKIKVVDGQEVRIPEYTGKSANSKGEVLLEMGKPVSFSMEPYTEMQINDSAVTINIIGPSGTLYSVGDLYDSNNSIPYIFENGTATVQQQFHTNTKSVWVDYKELTLVSIGPGPMRTIVFDVWYDAGTTFVVDREPYTVETLAEGSEPYREKDPERTEERTYEFTVRDQKLRISSCVIYDAACSMGGFTVEEVYDPGTVQMKDDKGNVLLEGSDIRDDKGNQYIYSVMGILKTEALDAPITVEPPTNMAARTVATTATASALALGGSAAVSLLPDAPDTTLWRRRRLGEDAPDLPEDEFSGEPADDLPDDLPGQDSPVVTLSIYKPYGDLVNTRGAAVDIPLSLAGGEGLSWHFVPTVVCPQGLKAVVPSVVGTGTERTLVLALTGAQMRVSHAELFVTVIAWAAGPDGRLVKTSASTEMKIHRPGIEASRTADGGLEVTCYTDSNLNGIAETRKLRPEEYTVATDPDTGYTTVTAKNARLGSFTLEA